jgi:hypothetical protein
MTKAHSEAGRIAWSLVAALAVIAVAITGMVLAWPHIEDMAWGKDPETQIRTVRSDAGLVIILTNLGHAKDTVKLTVSTSPEVIQSCQVGNRVSVDLTQSDPSSTSAIFVIKDLLSGEQQVIELKTEASGFSSITAWSYYTGDIRDIQSLALTTITAV